MTVIRSLVGLVGRLAQLLAPAPSDLERPLTEDDIRTDRYLRQHATRG